MSLKVMMMNGSNEPETLAEALAEFSVAFHTLKCAVIEEVEPPLVWLLNKLTRLIQILAA